MSFSVARLLANAFRISPRTTAGPSGGQFLVDVCRINLRKFALDGRSTPPDLWQIASDFLRGECQDACHQLDQRQQSFAQYGSAHGRGRSGRMALAVYRRNFL